MVTLLSRALAAIRSSSPLSGQVGGGEAGGQGRGREGGACAMTCRSALIV